jgi:hypothetical protein
MKKTKYFLNLIIIIGLAGCADSQPPAVPRGLRSITGDEEILLTWYENTEPDFAGYRIYRCLTPAGYYEEIGETDLDYFLDYGVINGQTYFYAISAFDTHGNESDLSYEVIYDTPRPEGYNEKIFDYNEYPECAGWNFSEYSYIPYDDPACDFYYGYDATGHYLYIGRSGGLLQDFGYTESLNDITYAPEQGWSSTGTAEAILGHTYVFWTWDNHFAKIRITSLSSNFIVFDWAYQIDPGNPELVMKGG